MKHEIEDVEYEIWNIWYDIQGVKYLISNCIEDGLSDWKDAWLVKVRSQTEACLTISCDGNYRQIVGKYLK